MYARDTTGPIYASHTCEVGPAPLYLYNPVTSVIPIADTVRAGHLT